MAEVVEGDGEVGEDGVPGGKAGERPTAQIHDDLDQMPPLRVGAERPPHPLREEHEQPPQLGVEAAVVRRRGELVRRRETRREGSRGRPAPKGDEVGGGVDGRRSAAGRRGEELGWARGRER